jgi:hypothetical protein
MNKIWEVSLEKKIAEIMKKGKASDIVGLLKDLQDASGLKICQNVTIGDPMYKEIK